MYLSTSFNGAELPAKNLCLTFDDGPGSSTLEIARFLFENHIRATFFVVGKYAIHQTDVLSELKKMGHLIGNHTYDHPDLPYYVSVNGNILDQTLRTDAIIKPYVDAEHIYFRAPYGKWSPEVAHELNKSILTINHIGPIHWEIAGLDCYYWQNEWPVEDACNWYLKEIEKIGRGIIVMHDDIADMDVVKKRTHTLELVKMLIPKVLEQGYQFVRLDEISSIKTASAEQKKFTLRTQKGKYVSLKNETELGLNGKAGNPQNLLQLTDLGYGKVAIKTATNLYLTASEKNEIFVKKQEIGSTETFDLIPVNENKIIFRSTSGNFLSAESNGNLTANAKYMRQATIFKYANHNLLINDQITFKKRVLLLKKQLLFVKSKLLQKFS